jgi:NAD(P)-dependent dehydrogenase (short-subunit alcohol dehydrogenase family)
MSSSQHGGSPDRDLQDSKALVTGATSGIGRAIAVQLAREGADVVVHGRDAARGADTVETITAAGGHARFVPADLSDPADIGRLARDVGDIDVLVNNAGFSVFGATADLAADRFDALYASNVRAPFFLVAAFAPRMAARGRGSIINVSSMAGQVGLPGGAAYGATKGAIESMTRAWAAEFSPSGVRVNAIAAGPVYTGGAVRERTEALGKTTPLNRAADAREIAEAVGFLASPRASYITGAIVAVDGGRAAI